MIVLPLEACDPRALGSRNRLRDTPALNGGGRRAVDERFFGTTSLMVIPFALVRRLAVLIGHLQEQQIGEPLQVVALAHAINAQVADAPNRFGDGPVWQKFQSLLTMAVEVMAA